MTLKFQMIWEGPKWGTMLVKNKSKKPIKHVTISMVAPRQENVSASPKFDASMGALGSRVTGEEDPDSLLLQLRRLPMQLLLKEVCRKYRSECTPTSTSLDQVKSSNESSFKSGLAFADNKGSLLQPLGGRYI